MGAIAGTVAVLSLLTSAVGTGISYFAQRDSAKTQSLFANLNASAGLQQTQAQGRAMALQAQLKAAQESVAQRTAQKNAASMREGADAQIRVDQENIRKNRMEFQAKVASVRAGRAGSGVVDTTGSPLDILVSASEDQALSEAEMGWMADNQRRKTYRQAQIEENQGKAHGINAGLAQVDGMAAVAAARMQGTQLELNRFGQIAGAQGMGYGAIGGLLSGLGSLGQGISNWSSLRTRSPRSL